MIATAIALSTLEDRQKAQLAAALLHELTLAKWGDFYDALSPADRETLLELCHREMMDTSRFEPAPF